MMEPLSKHLSLWLDTAFVKNFASEGLLGGSAH